MNRYAKPTAEESLIERAAKVYDFGAHLRGRAVPAYPEAETQADEPDKPLAPVPVADVPEPAASEQDAPPTAAPMPVAPPSPTLSAIPAEFLSDTDDDGLDEWEAPESDLAQIDRIMLAEAGMLVPGAPVGALAEEFRLVKRQLLLTAREIAAGPIGDRARTIIVGSGKPG